VVALVILVHQYVIINIEEKYICFFFLRIYRVAQEDPVKMDYRAIKVRINIFFKIKEKNVNHFLGDRGFPGMPGMCLSVSFDFFFLKKMFIFFYFFIGSSR
jgi:hypothetical protein